MHDQWNDGRLDDLQALVRANDRRLDQTEDIVIKHDEQLLKHEDQFVQIARTGDRREDRNWALKLTLATIAVSSVASFLLQVLSQHH